jgi:murein L,D-transpeptidase YcbB/YkuD
MLNIIALAMRLMQNRSRIAEISDLLDRVNADEPVQPESEYPVGSVEWLQESLNLLNDGNLEIDGDYGKLTRVAVEDYQSSHGLKVDGWAGPETISSIVNELEKESKEQPDD